MEENKLEHYKLELSVKAKNGVNFIAAASVVWLLITFVWTLSFRTYDKCVLTFIVGGLMLPLAWAFSKIFKTQWVVHNNPLESLGLWLNFAQLFYFPMLVFLLIKSPEYFVMTYVVITGAHFFPYAWYYRTKVYAVAAGVISVGAMGIALLIKNESQLFYLPAFMVICLVVTAVFVFMDYKKSLLIYDSTAWPQGSNSKN
ncbi:MAG: DUF7010 family protein [Flammeovirgaceae bacterium]